MLVKLLPLLRGVFVGSHAFECAGGMRERGRGGGGGRGSNDVVVGGGDFGIVVAVGVVGSWDGVRSSVGGGEESEDFLPIDPLVIREVDLLLDLRLGGGCRGVMGGGTHSQTTGVYCLRINGLLHVSTTYC